MGRLEAKSAEDKSMNYSIRSTEKAEENALSAMVTEPQRVTIDSAEKKEIPASVPVLHQPADVSGSPPLLPLLR